MNIGNQIKKIRELRNYNQSFMAAQLEMTTSGYSKIENNIVKLNTDKLEKIALILKVKPSFILEFDDDKIFNSSN